MAEGRGDLEALLSREKEQERSYHWFEAVESNEKLLDLSNNQGAVQRAQCLERLGYTLSRAAMQAEDKDEFRKRIEKSLKVYTEANEAFQRSSDPVAVAKALRCQAMSEYLRYWLDPEVSAKKQYINKAWKMAKDALQEFLELKQFSEVVKCCRELFLAAVLSFDFEEDTTRRISILTDLEKYVVEAANHVSEPHEVAESLVQLAACLEASSTFLPISSTPDFGFGLWEESCKAWRKAAETDEESAVLEKANMGLISDIDYAIGPDKYPQVIEMEQEYAKKTNDRLVLGLVKSEKAVYLSRIAWRIEDPDEFKAAVDEIEKTSEEARREFAPISFVAPDFFSDLWTSAPSAPWCAVMLSFMEMDHARKRVHADDGVKRAREQLEFAKVSQYPYAISGAHFILGRALLEAAKCETNSQSKQLLLRESAEHMKKGIEGEDAYAPSHFWNRGTVRCKMAEIEFELGRMSEDDSEKKSMLQTSASRMKEGLDLCMFWYTIPSYRELYDTTSYETLGVYWLDYGKILRSCLETARDNGDLHLAAAAFEKAAEFQAKAGILGRIAESWWEAARTYDLLGEHAKASERFLLASDCYGKAAEKIPQLRGFYNEHSSYLQAWSEIEKARLHHSRQEAAHSKECYNKAAVLHESTGKWSFLSTNYSAWAQVENAEDLSQKERSEESADAFREAEHLFEDSKKRMKGQLAIIDSPDEKQMVERLIDAADDRQAFCKARIALEEARLLDKGGDLSGASEKYGLVTDMFTEIQTGLSAKQDRKEIELIITLSKAWKAMAKAEADASPEGYADAAHLFEMAKELSRGEKAKALAMGHSRFCKALETGTRFADTRNPALHASAIKHLDSAASHYARAGAGSASEYSRASKLLFDAYAAMDRAGQETDHEKKAKAYLAVEKILEASAAGFGQAEQPGKKDQVLRLLEGVKRERALAMSITELFHAPLVVSSTASFASPTPTYEQPVGLERFEHADVQANLIASKKELEVDEDLDLRIEIVNAGRGPAQLIKLQDPVPKGFTLRGESAGYRMEDSFLNLRGKRLDPLKTEEINLLLKPTHRGRFALKPRILYLDESGKYKSHEPEPMRVTVGDEAAGLEGKAIPEDTREAVEARSLLAGLSVVTLSHYRIVGNYVRYSDALRNSLKDARQKIASACRNPSPKRENYIIWAPPGSGKTYFVQEVASQLGETIRYREINLAKLDEAGFRSGLAELRGIPGPWLCLIDEVDAKPDEPWPYEALLPFLDASATEGARFVFVLAGSSGSSIEEMKKAIASRPKGSDMLSRVPNDNEYSIASMSVGDRMLVVLSQFRQAGRQMGREVREVEKLGLYYVALNPRLSNARQLREFAVRCAERVLPDDDRLKYDSLFHPGDLENKIFWSQALKSASALVGSFLLVED